MAHAPTRNSWAAMIQRSCNPKHRSYALYGGRGVEVCERWRHSFANFLADMGPRPVGTSIDRIDNDGSYEPGNCRWATREEQARNKRMYPHQRLSCPLYCARGHYRTSVTIRFHGLSTECRICQAIGDKARNANRSLRLVAVASG